MKVVVSGLGSVGQRHLRNLLILGISDITLHRTGRSTLKDESLDRFPVEHDLDSMLSLDPDVVVIANPTSAHLVVAERAASRGCHMFLEKPVSNDTSGIAEILAEVEAQSLITMVGFQYRFHPAFQRTKEILESGQMGPVHSLHAHWGEYLPNWHPWEDYRDGYAARSELGGGVIRTLCHPVDYLRWFGGEISRIDSTIMTQNPLGIDVEQAALLALTFESGAIGSIYLDYLQRPKTHRFEIVCENGTLRWNETENHLLVLGRDQLTEKHEFLDYERNAMFLAEMEHFIKAVAAGQETLIPLKEGFRVQELLDEARTSFEAAS